MNRHHSKRILFVAMPDSIHTVRWINQITDQGWEIYLYPSTNHMFVHPCFDKITIFNRLLGRRNANGKKEKGLFLGRLFRRIIYAISITNKKKYESYLIFRLNRIIRKIKPDIIHSLEFQCAGYLTLQAKKKFIGEFPRWIATNWGSDIYLFGRLKEHQAKIKEVLSSCEYYSCECHRDVFLARKFGFKGTVLPVLSNTGGFNFEIISNLRQPGLTSERRLIMLKGYQNWAGRALVGLRALECCAELLQGYEIVIYCAEEGSSPVWIAAELFTESTKIPIRSIPLHTPHEEILHLHGRARISIGLSISDAISTSLLEAMVMGSFPIQSCTACADEWLLDGRTGILVPPEDPNVIELAIRRALTDDNLVNQAAIENYRVTKERLDKRILKPKVIEIYHEVLKQK